jgi:hypothetical protein
LKKIDDHPAVDGMHFAWILVVADLSLLQLRLHELFLLLLLNLLMQQVYVGIVLTT